MPGVERIAPLLTPLPPTVLLTDARLPIAHDVTTVTFRFVAPTRWILLSSRLPREPSRLRLAVWRRLRRSGAVLLHDAVWVLPADAKTREAFEWLAEEIVEQGGSAFVWEADSLEPAQDRELIRRFRAEADARYAAIARSARDILRTITRPRARGRPIDSRTASRQLAGLERALRLERRSDYFRAAGRQHAQAAVEAAIAGLEVSKRKARPGGDDDALDYPSAPAH
jgi:ChrB-like protein